MKIIWAMAMLTLRGAVRSSMFASTLLLAIIAAVAIPLAVKGDGSAFGNARIAVEYSLKTILFTLGSAMIWMSVRFGASDVENRQAHLLATKPVGGFEIWIGRWTGLLIMNAFLLATTGATVFAVISWETSDSMLPAKERLLLRKEVLVARSVVSPDRPATPPTVDDLAQKTLRPGESRSWLFTLGPEADGKPVSIGYRLTSPRQLDLKPVAVKWFAGPPGKAETALFEGNITAGTRSSFTLPTGIAGAGRFEIKFVNAQTDPPADVSFGARDGAVTYVTEGGFGLNMFKAMLIMFFMLAALAALGLTAGLLLSTPVALFASCAVVIVLMSGSFIQTAAADTEMTIYRTVRSISSFDSLMKNNFMLLNTIVSPIKKFDSISYLPRGRMIPWSSVTGAFGVFVILHGGILCLMGGGLFRRRELGLPAD